MTNPAPRPGWYPDPSGNGGQRYFDGTRWTAHFAPPPPPPAIVVTSATNHALHLILTLITCGLWLPVWVVMAVVGSASQVRYMSTPPPPMPGYAPTPPPRYPSAPRPPGAARFISTAGSAASGWVWLITGGVLGGLVLLGLVVDHPLLLIPAAILASVAFFGYREYQRGIERRAEHARLAARAESENEAVKFGDPSGFYGQYPPSPLPPTDTSDHL